MKATLLLAASLFSMVAQAQLSTIDENFNNFTAGSKTFPQNGWSAVLPTGPKQPQPMMIVTAGTDKAIQAYAGGSSNMPLYLVTPQIVAPAGDKAISFDTGLVESSPGTSTIQIGLATSPTDMSTFVAVGNPIQITSTTIQNIKVNIPASSGTYLVIKETPTIEHTALQIDNVKYDSNLSLNESSLIANIKFAVSSDNNFLKVTSAEAITTAKIYSASGQTALQTKVTNSTINISTLQSGIYFIILENINGKTFKSKFIKK